MDGIHFRREPKDILERVRPQAHQRREWHAVHVATGRGVGCVDVRVGIDPDQPHLLPAAAVELGNAGDGSDRDGMISAEGDGGHDLIELFQDPFGSGGAGLRDLIEIACILITGLPGFGDRDSDVAAINNDVPEALEVGFQPGDAHG